MPNDYSALDTRPSALRTFRLLAGFLAAAVLVQAALAGQFLFKSAGARDLHRYVGEGIGLLALAVAWQGWRIRHRSGSSWWISLALLLLVVAMTGLGFAGRKQPSAAATHVPLGVATFGLAVAAAVIDRPRPYR